MLATTTIILVAIVSDLNNDEAISYVSKLVHPLCEQRSLPLALLQGCPSTMVYDDLMNGGRNDDARYSKRIRCVGSKYI